MFNFNYGGIRWGYTFLRTDSRLTEEQRQDIMYRATSMYLSNRETVHNFRDEQLEYEGRIVTKGNFGSVGGMWGQIFDAEADTQFGKAKLKFLVNEQTVGSTTSASNN